MRRSTSYAATGPTLAIRVRAGDPGANKLAARKAVLENFEAQYALLEQYGLTPGELDEELARLAPPQNDEESELLDEESELLVVTF